MQYKNIAGRFFGLVTKHACEGQTDRQNYDSQDRAGIAASRGKKEMLVKSLLKCCLSKGVTVLSKLLVQKHSIDISIKAGQVTNNMGIYR